MNDTPIGSIVQSQLAKTPWWMMSVAFHAVLVMVMLLAVAQVVPRARLWAYAAEVVRPPLAFEEEWEEAVEDVPADPRDVSGSAISDTPNPSLDDTLEDDSADGGFDYDGGESESSAVAFGIGLQGDTPSSSGRSNAVYRSTNCYGNCARRRRVVPAGEQVQGAFGWLARHQSADGSWSCDAFSHRCTKNVCDGAGSHAEYTPGTTSLALLAFVTAGNTHRTGRYKVVVNNGLKYLARIQTADGCVGAKSLDGHELYNHAIATMALAEAYGASHAPSLKQPAQRAVDYLVSMQNPYAGWRYGKSPGDNDTSITGWAVLALKSAKLAELHVAPEAFAGARNWIDAATDESFFKTGYTSKGDAGARLPEAAKFRATEAMTAAGLCVRLFTGARRDDPAVKGGATLLRNQPPAWDAETGNDFYYWYYGSLAMFQMGGNDWKVWEQGMKKALVKTQRQGGDEAGSWDPTSAWGAAGGRVYATAINALSLQVYYRYQRVQQRTKR
jgi:hypothetical protein